MSECKQLTRQKKSKTYRVWIEQVNQTYVDVTASCKSEAMKKGYTKWKREDAHSRVTDVQDLS